MSAKLEVEDDPIMQKYTHLVVGAFTATLIGLLLYRVPIDLIRDWNKLLTLQSVKSTELLFWLFTDKTPLMVQGAIFGILPDLDQLLKGLLDHRCGLTHSVFTFAFFTPLIMYMLSVYFGLSPYLIIISAGCVFSHWFIDALNPSGVRTIGFYLSFFRRHRCDLRLARIRYNNHLANIVLCGALLGILFWLGFHQK